MKRRAKRSRRSRLARPETRHEFQEAMSELRSAYDQDRAALRGDLHAATARESFWKLQAQMRGEYAEWRDTITGFNSCLTAVSLRISDLIRALSPAAPAQKRPARRRKARHA